MPLGLIRPGRRLGGLIGAGLILAGVTADVGAPPAHSAGRAVAPPRVAELRPPTVAELARACGHLRKIPTPDGKVMCTHGPDPAPPGVDFRVPQPLPVPVPGRAEGLLLPDSPGGAPSQAAAQPGLACDGDGLSGNRVEALYAFPAGHPDRYSQVVPSIRQWTAELDAVFQQSAAQTGGTRRVRFVTDGNCDLVIGRVPLSAQSDDTFENTIAELAAKGYNRSDRKYLVWMDATELCGIGTYYNDDRPGAENFNNGRPGVPGSVARIDSGCWGLGSRGQSVEAHELVHNLGAVILNAPNSTPAGHCNDDADRMCYADGTPLLQLLSVCPASQEALLDCGHDDYFSTAPGPGNYLSTHWNTASSSFLLTSAGPPTLSIGDASVSEGHAGAVSVGFPVTLSARSDRPVTVRFATADGAARAPADYTATSGTLTFSPGETAKAITVAVQGDRDPEVNETFLVNLSAPANAVLERSTAFGTILDDEAARAQGYWFVAADGGIFAFGDAGFYGSTGAIRLNKPIVGMAVTPSGGGYWLVASDGGIFAFGDAGFHGSTGGIQLSQPIVGMAATPSGRGYWFAAADGGIFAFGDAKFYGAASLPSDRPVVGIAATPSGRGYWLVARDGTVSAHGDAPFAGHGGGLGPVSAIGATPTGAGYWVAGSSGAVGAFGDARTLGGVSNLNQPVVGLASTPKGGGYWLVARDGGIFSFGDAGFYGSTGAIRLNQPIVGMTAPGFGLR